MEIECSLHGNRKSLKVSAIPMCGVSRLLGVSSERNWELREQADRKILSITQGKPIRIQAVKRMSVPDGEVSGSWDALLGIAGVSGGKGPPEPHRLEVGQWGVQLVSWGGDSKGCTTPRHTAPPLPWDLKCVTYSYHRNIRRQLMVLIT